MGVSSVSHITQQRIEVSQDALRAFGSVRLDVMCMRDHFGKERKFLTSCSALFGGRE